MISFDMDSMFERSKMIYEYCTKSCKYNHFVIDVLPKAITVYNDDEFVEYIMTGKETVKDKTITV